MVLNYPADRPGREVEALDLARAAYQHESEGVENKLSGVLGQMGRRCYNDYGKRTGFFTVRRQINIDRSAARFTVCLPRMPDVCDASVGTRSRCVL
jgi:hypothetical protein